MTNQSSGTSAEVLEINSRQRTFIRYLTRNTDRFDHSEFV